MKYKKAFIIVTVIICIILYTVIRAAEKWQSITISDGIPHKNIKDIKTDKKTVYIATANGLAIYDITKRTVVRVQAKDGLADNYVSSIAVDKNYVWIGTANGLSRYDKKSKKLVNFTKNSGLADNVITAVAIDGDFVWVGTKYWGISRYDKVINAWKSFTIMDGLIDNAVNCISVEGEFIWVGHKSGLSQYDKIMGMWGGWDNTMGIPPNTEDIKSIEAAGEYLWMGTVNGLLRFDKDELFKLYTTSEGLVDDFIQNLKLDGQYLWIGTFSGVSRFNVLTDDWRIYTTQDGLIENVVSCLEVSGNKIWFGTDNGISVFNKEIPQAYISPFSDYSKAGTIMIMGTAFDYDNISSYKIEYKNASMKDYVSAGVMTVGKDNVIQDKLAQWDVKKILNVSYDVKLTVTDRKGNKNVTINSIVVDTEPPEITLSALPEAIKVPTILIQGTFMDNNISKIVIDINKRRKEKAEIDRITKKYSKEIQLKKGKNIITVKAFDVANLSKEKSAKIVYDKEKPVIELKELPAVSKEEDIKLEGRVIDSGIQQLKLNPGNREVTFTENKDGSFSFSQEVRLRPGDNKFEIIAYDFVGNKAVANPVIEYESSLPTVEIDKSVVRVTKPDFTVKGKLFGGNIDYIMVEPFNKKAKINYANKTFSLKTRLKKGANVITANIVNKDGNKTFDMLTVLYTTEKAALNLTDLQDYTFEKNIKLSGFYNEPNFDKLILNPGEKSVAVNSVANTFSIKVELNEGKNDFELTMTDKVGSKTTKKFSIILDTISPYIELSMVPTTVYSKKVNIAGKIKEENFQSILIQPGNIKCKVNKEDNSFSSAILLKNKGKNEFKFIAQDKAGNETTESRTITYVPKAIEVAKAEKEGVKVDPEYIKELKDEIARLKERLRVSSPAPTVVFQGERKFTLPNKNGLALVPFSRLKVNSIFEISKKYLGNYIYIDFINKYNNTGRVTKDRRILLPTKKFIRDYVRIKDKKVKDIVDIIAISYKSSKSSHTAFKKKLAFNLYKKNFISKNEFNFLIKNNYLKGANFLISLGRNRKGSYPYIINVFYNRSFMDINIKRNKAYGRK